MNDDLLRTLNLKLIKKIFDDISTDDLNEFIKTALQIV